MSRTNRTIPLHLSARALFVVVTLTLAVQRPARAQDSTVATRDGWIVGPLVGLPGIGSEAAYPLVTLGVGVTRLVPNHMGLDFAIGTAPRVIADGLVPVAARIGPSIPLALGPNAYFIPSAGFSAMGLASVEGVGGVAGWYAGGAAVMAHGPVGFRAGVTLHSPLFAARPVWLAEIGIMRVPLPRVTH
jgi:hypothetical protein